MSNPEEHVSIQHPDQREEALRLAGDFARRLIERCGRTGFTVRLFGSRARGDADEDSDVDLFVEVQGADTAKVRQAADEIAGDLTLEHGILFTPFVADRAFMEARRGYSFLAAVATEGIPVEP